MRVIVSTAIKELQINVWDDRASRYGIN